MVWLELNMALENRIKHGFGKFYNNVLYIAPFRTFYEYL